MRGEPADASQQSDGKSKHSSNLNGSPFANGHAGNGVSTNGHSTAQRGTSASTSAPQPPFFGHDREEVTRILIQGLTDLGYQAAANTLSQESGFQVETSHAAAFRLAVLEGNWQEAEALILGPAADPHDTVITQGLLLAPDASRDEMLFLLRQQKYLELVEKRDIGQALMVLREELQPLRRNERQLHVLSSLIMVQSSDDLRAQARWDGAAGDSRRDLLSVLSRSISPSAMIPEHRLAELLTHVKESQIANCEYHNTTQWPSLYTDHLCAPDAFPLEILMELHQHKDEVWFIKFSHDGKKLATASKDCTVKIYDTNRYGVLHTLSEHTNPVAFVAWSPDDSKIVTCSQDSSARLWDADSGRCIRIILWHTEPVTSAAWAPDGKTFVTGSFDKNKPLTIWDATTNDPTCLHNFEHADCRVQDVAIATMLPPASSIRSAMPHEHEPTAPVRLVVSCIDKSVHVYDYHRREKISHIQLDFEITCLNLSGDGQEMLLNLNCGEVWALGVDSGEVVQKYKGQKQGNFVIRGSYGGASEGVVISGGEDSKICIWHRHSGRMIENIDAHTTGCVNAVAWNMANPCMWASAGDDNRVRIWAHPPQDVPRTPPDADDVAEWRPEDFQTPPQTVPVLPQWSGGSDRRGF